MTECSEINENLINYINQSLPRKQSCEVILHLADCKRCREEIASLIIFKDQQAIKVSEVPQKILQTAFAKLPKKENTLESILNSNSFFMAFDLINYSLSTVKQTLSLAKQAI